MRDFSDARFVFFLALFLTHHACSLGPSNRDSNYSKYSTAVLVGYGYSTDKQQVTHKKCFNATVGKIYDRIAVLMLDKTVSDSDLQRKFGVDLTSGFGLFSTDVKAEYIRSLQDDEYSVSVNYYVAHQEEVEVKIDGKHEHALTVTGQDYYEDQTYQNFGLTCGDYYIQTFVQGAVLFAELKIVLESLEDKSKLEANVGFKLGSFADVASKIQSVSNSNNISGTIQIRAFQYGGDTTKLTKVLGKNISHCNVKDTSQCKAVIETLISYANEFGNQIEDGKGLEALGSFNYLPIGQLGLIAPNSSVTPEVAQSRKDLAFKLKENQYYQQKLSPFVHNKYPVKLDDELIRHLKSLLSKAERNLELIMDPKKGAVRCFELPEHCEEIKNEIYHHLNNIKTNDLKFLEGMKYIFHFQFYEDKFIFYNAGEDLQLWKSVPNSEGHSRRIEMVKFLVSDESFEYYFKLAGYSFRFNGTYDRSQDAFVGTLELRLEIGIVMFDENHIQELKHSPFFFEEYNNSMDFIMKYF